MMHLTIIHYILIFIFLLIFILLVILSSKESDKRNRIILIILSFIISTIGSIVSLLLLDHYTKKAKLVKYSTSRYSKNNVTIRGSIKNIGKYYISYCSMDIRILNKIDYSNKKKIYFKTSSFSDMVKDSKYKKNFISTTVKIVEELKPKETKYFTTKVEIPKDFQNLKYFFHLVCH